jgi:Fe-S oxidoreductase
MEKTLGISAKRSLPHYAQERFDRWFEKRIRRLDRVSPHRLRGKVILWDDTFVRYHEPHIGVAAVKVLKTLGFDVALLTNRLCCGRPAFSQGNLDAAARAGKHNVELLTRNTGVPPVSATDGQAGRLSYETPIIFLEPSCYSMFVEDYRELKIDNAESIAKRCFLFEKFVDDLLSREPEALQFNRQSANVVIHAHCHAKSLLNPAFMARLAERLPGRKATLLDTGCCGMAGAFGMLESKYELSLKVAADLLNKIDKRHPDVVIASGTSCRHQIVDLTNARPKHMAELVAEAIVD